MGLAFRFVAVLHRRADKVGRAFEDAVAFLVVVANGIIFIDKGQGSSFSSMVSPIPYSLKNSIPSTVVKQKLREVDIEK